MSASELKSNLHRLIVETDDLNILKKIQEVFDSLRSESQAGNSLSDVERKMIEKGIKDVETGNVISNNEVKSKFQNWISEKRN